MPQVVSYFEEQSVKIRPDVEPILQSGQKNKKGKKKQRS